MSEGRSVAAAGATAKRALAFLIAAGVLSPLVLRAVALVEHPAPLALLDLSGAWADVAVGASVAVLMGLAARKWRALALVLAALWVGLNYANYESVRALGSMLNLGFAGYLGDPTFLLGSALSPLRPFLLAGLLVTTLGLVWLGTAGTAPSLSPRRAWAAVVGLLLLGFPVIVSQGAELWRQTHVVTANLRWGVTRDSPLGGETVAPGDLLDGTRMVGPAPASPNVLLILVEAASGAYVEPSAQAHGLTSSVTMPGLSAFATRGLNYTNFVLQQVQTNRGQYAVLCGDYPKLALGTPKMSDAVAADTMAFPCLPAALRDLGYETVYVQSAPLPFMLKDQFMPLAGFARTYGASWFRTAYARDMWGVDDRAFFEQSLEMVQELESGDAPWLLTLLTSGTHHPYRVPRDVIDRARTGADAFALAIRYGDAALQRFLEELATRGVLEHTLVIVTADESNGLHDEADALTARLSRNWGPLVILAPAEPGRQIDAPFLQMDLAPSVLDYLGFEDLAAAYPGRSVFRVYPSGRLLGFGNVYERAVFVLTEDDRLISCDDTGRACLTYALAGPERLFSPDGSAAPSTTDDRELVGQVIRRSASAPHRPGAVRVIALLAATEVDVEAHSLEGATVLSSDGEATLTRQQYVFGGQSLTIPAGARVDVDIAFELLGEPGASADFLTDLGTLEDRIYGRETGPVMAGQRVTIGYTFVPDRPWTGVDARLWARALSGRSRIRFERAQLTLTLPDGHQHPVTGARAVEREFQVR